MAKQLLGKEVTAALNEKIKANVAELEAKGVKPTLGIIRVGEREDDISYFALSVWEKIQVIFLMRRAQQNAARL